MSGNIDYWKIYHILLEPEPQSCKKEQSHRAVKRNEETEHGAKDTLSLPQPQCFVAKTLR